MNKKACAVKALAAAMCMAAILGGCGDGAQDTAQKAFEQVSFPVEDDVTLTIWKNNIHMVVKNEKDMACYKEMEKLTGVKVDMIHPVAGQRTEQFNIMIASQELPDIIMNFDSLYSGGVIKGYNDNVIHELSGLMEKNAPNLNKLYERYPQLKMEASDDQGRIFTAPMIRGDSMARTYRGPVIRADYLEKFNLDVPETIDEWYQMLTTFKQNGIDIPFTTTASFLRTESFMGAYGVAPTFFLDDGKAAFGPYDERYKEYVKTMAKWYSEGLIDSEITTNDQKTMDSKVMSFGAGSFIGTTGNQIGGYLEDMKSQNTDFDLVAAPYPGLVKGEPGIIIQRDPMVQPELGASITTACKYPEIAMAYLDYAYGKEGHKLFNFGIEGESYEMQDGVPVYTDIVMNNPDGLTVSKAGSLYALAFTSGPFVQDKYYVQQFYGKPQQQAAGKTWAKDVDKYVEKNTVLLGTLTPEESEEAAPMLNEINTYANEQFVKWMMGQGDVETEFESYRDTLKQLGIEKVLQFYQAAYDRYIEKYPEMKTQAEYNVSDFFWEDEAE